MTTTDSPTIARFMRSDLLRTLFGVPIPEDHQQRIDRYTAELTD